MAQLRDQVQLTRERSAELRRASQRLRQRSEATKRVAQLAIAAQRSRSEAWVLPSPWSTLPWRAPSRELDQVLVAVKD